MRKSDRLPAEPVWRLIETVRRRRGLTLADVAHLVGERGRMAIYNIGRQRTITRDRAERILRGLADLPRSPSAFERALPSRRWPRGPQNGKLVDVDLNVLRKALAEIDGCGGDD